MEAREGKRSYCIRMAVLDDLLASLEGDSPVRSVNVGVHCTAVVSRAGGLAATAPWGASHTSHGVRGAGELHLRTARELAACATSENTVEASIGIAAINSLLEVPRGARREVNGRTILMEKARGRRVALVGHFPFVAELREKAGTLWVLELRPGAGDYPADAAPVIVPEADILAVTGSALVNHTLDGLLALARPGAFVMLMGPSTPLSPVLFDHGVDVVAGAVIEDEARAIPALTQGASFRRLPGLAMYAFGAI
ncbi:MAG: Rossmann-like domain-containing protein [Vicinamibacterales bacterium]